MKCPGQNMRYWTPDDIFNVACPKCQKPVEFFKDDAMVTCPYCKGEVRNPKIFEGCAQWCQYAEKCIGESK